MRKDGVPGFPFIDGDLFFDITILGDYVIGVTADEAIYLPTYFEQTFLWEEADTLEFRNVALQADMKMTPIPGPLDPADEGLIFGILEEEFPDEEDARIDARRRRSGTRVHARARSRSGRGDQDDEYILIASVETNENGEFALPNLPEGQYRINFEYPGVPMDPNSFIEFEIGPAGGDFTSVQLEALVAESGVIVVEEVKPVGVDNLFSKLEMYPNPASSQLTIDYVGLNRDDVSLYMIDINGQIVHKEAMPRATRHTHILNLSQFSSGIYFVTMRDERTGEIMRTMKLLIAR